MLKIKQQFLNQQTKYKRVKIKRKHNHLFNF